MSVALSTICKVVTMAFGFCYRILFLKVLTIQYLGINGLFTNILGVLSLAELGIQNAIVYRLYEPISKDDVKKVGQIMSFFKRSYHVIALVILCLGVMITPFLHFFIRDVSEVPVDINIYYVFILFLLQTAASYLFTYKLTILVADQRQYLYSVISTGIAFAGYLVQTIVLVFTRNYMITLASGIAVILFLNWVASFWVTNLYKTVFSERSRLDQNEKKEIFSDTFAAMLHRVGATVLSSTDNILLSKFIGLVVTGIYSNYATVTTNLSNVLSMAFFSFTASLGNAHVALDKEDKYDLYKKALYVNFYVVGLTTVCLYELINDFIYLWLGDALFLGDLTVAFISIQFYMINARRVSMSYISASGLFVRDKPRPIIEAVLNLVISIVALRYIGVAGIFLGTIISCGVTAFWREPLLLYKYAFGKSVFLYWKEYLINVLLCLVAIGLVKLVKNIVALDTGSVTGWLCFGIIISLVYIFLHWIIYHKSEEYAYFIAQLRGIMKRAGMNRE
jgi:O-antigen/teichoic acid export membrane protein